MVGLGLDADVMLRGVVSALRGEAQREQQEEGEEAHGSGRCDEGWRMGDE
jgi:hypothetical protein